MPLFAALDGPILDAPCGYGRHALSLQELGCRITCADIDDKALEQLACFNKIFAEAGQKILNYSRSIWLMAIRHSKKLSLVASELHFYESKLITNIAYSLVSDGLLYIETIANRKGNFMQLPKAGEIRNLLADTFEFLHLEESHAGPTNSGKVTVRMLARRI